MCVGKLNQHCAVGGKEYIFCKAKRITTGSGDTIERPCNWNQQTGLPCRHMLAANKGRLDLASIPARWRMSFERGDMPRALPRCHLDTKLGLTMDPTVDRTRRVSPSGREGNNDEQADNGDNAEVGTNNNVQVGENSVASGSASTGTSDNASSQTTATAGLSVPLLHESSLRTWFAPVCADIHSDYHNQLLRHVLPSILSPAAEICVKMLCDKEAKNRFDDLLELGKPAIRACADYHMNTEYAVTLMQLFTQFDTCEESFENPLRNPVHPIKSWYRELFSAFRQLALMTCRSETSSQMLKEFLKGPCRELESQVPRDTRNREPRCSLNSIGGRRKRRKSCVAVMAVPVTHETTATAKSPAPDPIVSQGRATTPTNRVMMMSGGDDDDCDDDER